MQFSNTLKRLTAGIMLSGVYAIAAFIDFFFKGRIGFPSA